MKSFCGSFFIAMMHILTMLGVNVIIKGIKSLVKYYGLQCLSRGKIYNVL